MSEDKIRLYSEEEAASLLGMSPRMLANRRRAGRIGAIKDGRVIGYTLAHLKEYLRRSQRRSAASIDELDPELLIKALQKKLQTK